MASTNERRLYIAFGIMLTAIIGTGLWGDAQFVLAGVWELQWIPARLIQDFSVAHSPGAALVNAALVAAIGLVLVWRSNIRLSGPTIASIFTMLGFGLFGKTPANALPIIAGVALAARFAGKSFGEYIIIALFGTALGPIVTMVAIELVPGAPLIATASASVIVGVITGVLLPGIAIAMLRLHQGYSLYNMGLTSGFLAIFVASIALAGVPQLGGAVTWNTDPGLALELLIPVLSVTLILFSVAFGSPARNWAGFRTILKLDGRLPSDFLDIAGNGAALLNMGVMGLLSWGYVVAVGAPRNGPVLGGILTIIGFGAFGKHPRNTWSLVAGVLIATLLFGWRPNDPGPILAALFVTTLAPLAGTFGPAIGITAGFLHMVMVMRTGAWHAGLNLYNNGFAGGLTATILLALIEWYKNARERDALFGSRKEPR